MRLGAELIELHTGHYANKFNSIDEFDALSDLSVGFQLC